MASAGRILIMPKGTYDANTEYEMLDLVFHNGTSWLAKGHILGIEPSESNAEYWFKLLDTTGLVNSISVDEINALSKTDLGKAATATDLYAKYDTPTFVSWSSATLNTPYKAGLTNHREGFALVSGDVTTYHTIVAWTKGGSSINFWIHQFNGGTDLGWGTFLRSSGGTLTGDLIIQKNKPLIQMVNTESERTSNFGSASDGSSTMVGNYKASDDQTNLLLKSSNDGLENIARLAVDGKSVYKLFGEHNIELLAQLLSTTLSGFKIETRSYTGDGESGGKTFTFDFAPKFVVIIGHGSATTNNTSLTVIIPHLKAGNTLLKTTELNYYLLDVETSGNTVTITDTSNTNFARFYECNANLTYSLMALG